MFPFHAPSATITFYIVCNTELVQVRRHTYFIIIIVVSLSTVIAAIAIIFVCTSNTHFQTGGEYNLSIYCTELRVSGLFIQPRAAFSLMSIKNKYVDNAELDIITNVRFWKSVHNSHYSLCWLDVQSTWNIIHYIALLLVLTHDEWLSEWMIHIRRQMLCRKQCNICTKVNKRKLQRYQIYIIIMQFSCIIKTCKIFLLFLHFTYTIIGAIEE